MTLVSRQCDEGHDHSGDGRTRVGFETDAVAEGSFAPDAVEFGPGNLWDPTPGPTVGG